MSCLNRLSTSFQHEGVAVPLGVHFISNSSWLLEPESDSLHHFPLRLQVLTSFGNENTAARTSICVYQLAF